MAATAGAGEAPGRLGFAPLVPAPDVSFWQELTQRKLDVLRLDSRPLPISGYFEAPPAPGTPAKCFLLRESFSEPSPFQAGSVLMRGDVKNFNTVEEFRGFLASGARAARIAEAAEALQKDIVSGDALTDPVLLRPLIVVAFADLKKYHFAYTVAFPVLTPPSSWATYAAPCGVEEAGFDRELLCRLSRELREDAALAAAGAFLLVRGAGAAWETRRLGSLAESAAVPDGDLVVAFVDSSSADAAPGWPLRNLVLAVARHRPGRHRFLAFRDPGLAARAADAPVRSRVFFVDAPAEAATAALESSPPPPEAQFAGWTKIQNFDLTAFLDKGRMAADAVDLNVKLMKWRLLPELEPERMKGLRFLLLGAGTLGCHLARALMGWGVRRMTFVDSGRVSLSNPVRQSLFTHRDAAEGRPKAAAACEAVRAVMPDAEAEAVEMEIPMPGHKHQSPEALAKAVQRLKDLVAAHDIVCMLTDSRESRWLPSLLVAASQRAAADRQERLGGGGAPLGLTVALGFDSFLVSRQTYRDAPAACYFCNDVTAPADSIAFRTLDQQCTVTRPGLAGLAASAAAELVAALSQHRDGFRAPGGAAAADESPLGSVPHQVRGYLAEFRLAPAETEPFSRCICCAPPVLECYERDGLALVERVAANPAELEEISGLAAMKAASREDEVVNFDDFDEEA